MNFKRQETLRFFITGREEKVRETDGEVLSESRTLSESLHQETGRRSQRGEYARGYVLIA
jgi:hypothetical protein